MQRRHAPPGNTGQIGHAAYLRAGFLRHPQNGRQAFATKAGIGHHQQQFIFRPESRQDTGQVRHLPQHRHATQPAAGSALAAFDHHAHDQPAHIRHQAEKTAGVLPVPQQDHAPSPAPVPTIPTGPPELVARARSRHDHKGHHGVRHAERRRAHHTRQAEHARDHHARQHTRARQPPEIGPPRKTPVLLEHPERPARNPDGGHAQRGQAPPWPCGVTTGAQSRRHDCGKAAHDRIKSAVYGQCPYLAQTLRHATAV